MTSDASQCCGCQSDEAGSPPSGSNLQSDSPLAALNNVSVFDVPKMDCPSEENLIRTAFASFGETVAFEFDTPNRKVHVYHADSPEKVEMAMESVGLGARRISHEQLDAESAREEIRDIVVEIISIKNVVMSISEQEQLLDDICNDVLGYGPLEPLLARDDIADIMVNGADTTYIEVNGKIERTNIRFRDNAQLMNICQRIVSQVGRRVDDSSPICDARLLDGSRVNVIAPPLAIDGPTLTIRKFKKDKLRLQDLVNFGSISEPGAELLRIIGHSRCNILISGGTGSGKTTTLNALSSFIDNSERILTIEDTAELQLQQVHVGRMESRPPNVEGKGAVTPGDCLKNALRMRPDRIIVGETRGAEVIDMLQAMNTGHDGSMGTLHANSPRECLGRMENMILMGDIKIPKEAISRQIAESVDLIVQVKRLRDGSRRTTNITEVIGMEGDVIVTQELFKFEYLDESEDGKIMGEYRSSGLRPYTLEKARQFGFDQAYLEACL